MSLLWMDGFDQFANTNSGATTASTLGMAGYTSAMLGTNASTLFITTGREAGTYAVRLEGAGGGSATLSRSFKTTANRVIIGFAFMANARGRVVSIVGLTDLDWPTGFKLNGVDGESIPIRNIWYYIELVINKTAKTIEVWVNNRLDLTAPMPAEGTNMTDYTVTWGGVGASDGSNSIQRYIDDLMFIDNAGSDGLRDRVGPIDITTRFPTSDVDPGWVPAVEGPLYPMVNTRPPEAGKYIQSNVAGAEATFGSNQPLRQDSQVFALGVVARALKTDIDRRAIGLIWGTGAQRLEVIDSNLSTTHKYSYGFFEKPAAGQSWTKEIVEAQPFGVKVRP